MTPLAERTSPPDENEALSAIGFSTTEPTLGNKAVSLSAGKDLLLDLVDQKAQYDLHAMGIDLHTRILRFSSPLNSGMSGGPIIDSKGEVVAVVAGGQENVPAPSSWGWPVSSLEQLQVSAESVKVDSRPRSGVLFSIKQPEDLLRRRCGALEFTLDRRLSYADATRYPDDQNELNQLVARLTGVSDISNQSFDIWREKNGGAIVLVPAGAELNEFADHCMAQLSGEVKEVVWGQQLLVPLQLPNFISQFERSFGIGVYGVPVAPVPRPIDTVRPDGARFIRESATLGLNIPGQNPLPKAVIEQKSMSRGGSVVIVQVANEVVRQMAPAFLPYGGPTAPQFASQCATLITGINCDKIAESAREIVAFQLAAELSTYPPY